MAAGSPHPCVLRGHELGAILGRLPIRVMRARPRACSRGRVARQPRWTWPLFNSVWMICRSFCVLPEVRSTPLSTMVSSSAEAT